MLPPIWIPLRNEGIISYEKRLAISGNERRGSPPPSSLYQGDSSPSCGVAPCPIYTSRLSPPLRKLERFTVALTTADSPHRQPFVHPYEIWRRERYISPQ